MVQQTFGFEKTEIQSFYSNKTLFITGGTGFVGSTLIEKLLRTCPDIKKIFLLIRSKKGKDAEERFKEMYDDVYWQKLKLQYPNFKEKLVLIGGDLLEKNLGFSETDRNTLINEVEIVFHVAATVRFDEALRKAAYINIQATKDMLELCGQMEKLQTMVHISTAYSNCILPELEEKIYPPMRNPEEFIEFCDKNTVEQLDEMTPSIIKLFPNTYTYTKGLAESLVHKYSNKIPVTIVRPSIVMGCWEEPIRGFADNIFGPFGIMAGAGNGLIHVVYLDRECVTDLIPVDMVVNCMIAAGLESSKRDFRNKEMEIYNIVSSNQNSLTWGDFIFWLVQFSRTYASVHTIWVYFFIFCRTDFMFNACKYFVQTLPAQLVDTVLKLRGQKPRLVKIYEKVDKLSNLLKYFATNQWLFRDENTQKLYKKLSIKDQILYNFDIKQLEWDEYLLTSVRAVRVHLLKDPISTIPQAQKKIRKLTIAHYTLIFFIIAIIGSFFYLLYSLIF